MDTLQLGPKRYQVATSWNQLKRAQLLQIVRVLYGPKSHYPLKLRLLSVISGAPLDDLLRRPAVQMVQLYPLTDFLFDEEQYLTEQLLPEVRVPVQHVSQWRARWVGPRSSFRNLLFGEFIFADTYFRLYATRQSAEALDLLVATLYRPMVPGLGPRHPQWQGDRREPFNEHRTEYYVKHLRTIPDAEKLAIYTWYRGCRQQLEREFPEVFEAAETTANAQASDWGRVLRKLSGGAFGPLEQTARQHARTVLAEMQDMARDYQKALKQAKK
ncbi:hypothetical protein MUN82_06515 [Hymenobacter aerilatus]|uniref:Uncharacterized protein n=1 Tax=Hymenobacter aerilatus TaxID=2932251 RepID=A0A8T9SXC6_9BACT|nr:hypothetical protein [Hymenobacter aerilatus]UOR06748.1 hypothetical protein MUN82_06515 [Hymenobacter aerilatus]